ncbi:MAG: RNA polymerase sigma factor [Anaerovoracaceae bacterium]
MEDKEIVELYFQRKEDAIACTSSKYGRYLGRISFNILKDSMDAEECVNDTYMKAWNTIPPKRPDALGAFLAVITRNLSLDKYKYKYAAKRADGEFALLLSELEECIPDVTGGDRDMEGKEISRVITDFLRSRSEDSRKIFVMRYFYCDSIKEIALRTGFSQSKVKSSLFTTRNALKKKLIQEGIYI